jgi:hypothetical protein
MIRVMASWDGRKFDPDPHRIQIARLALCQIGLHWHPSDRFPYDFELIAERLREFTPGLGADQITGRTMREILTAYHVPVRC